MSWNVPRAAKVPNENIMLNNVAPQCTSMGTGHAYSHASNALSVCASCYLYSWC